MDTDPLFPGHGLPPDLDGAGGPVVLWSDFLRSPPGRYMLQWEQQHLDAAVSDIFGYHALQLGLPELDALRENRMPLRIRAADRGLAPEPGAGHPCRLAVVNRYEELPFATQSIDLVVMPHILEFAGEPHQVLREVDRVLVPEGHVVITGFNPASLWGLRQALTRLGAAPYLPREAQFISLHRIKDWLKLLSFEVNRGRFGCWRPLVAGAGLAVHGHGGQARARHAHGGLRAPPPRGTAAGAGAGGLAVVFARAALCPRCRARWRGGLGARARRGGQRQR